MAESRSKADADLEALQLEVNQAFCPKKNKKFKARMWDLEWMYEQCSTGELFQLYSGDRSKLTLFDRQTYRQWKSHIDYGRVVNFRRLRRKTIVIQPIVLSAEEQRRCGYVDTEIHEPVLEFLRYYCEAFFTGMSVKVAPSIDLSTVKKITKRVHNTTNRVQYLVGDLMKYLQSICPKYAFSIVGVTMVDIYPGPEWNFVLGQASITTGCGVFSFGRFFKTAPQVTRKVAESCQIKEMWILMRVMTHELCHIFGIKHCYYFKCSLNESSSIAEAATQPLFACPICLKKLKKSLQFNTLERYRVLLEATKEMQRAVSEALQVHCDHGPPGPSPAVTDCEEATEDCTDKPSTTHTTSQVDPSGHRVADSALIKDPTLNHTPSELLHNHQTESTNEVADASSMDPLVSSLPRELWHSEQLEYFSRAINWLEQAITNLERYQLMWEERRSLSTGKR